MQIMQLIKNQNTLCVMPVIFASFVSEEHDLHYIIGKIFSTEMRNDLRSWQDIAVSNTSGYLKDNLLWILSGSWPANSLSWIFFVFS